MPEVGVTLVACDCVGRAVWVDTQSACSRNASAMVPHMSVYLLLCASTLLCYCVASKVQCMCVYI